MEVVVIVLVDGSMVVGFERRMESVGRVEERAWRVWRTW